MKVDFRHTQRAFSDYLRDPAKHPAPSDVKPERMAMYRELFYNNIDNFLASNFPVLRTLFNDTDWHAMAQDFFARHRCSTPYFSEIAEEFLDYLQNERQNAGDLPFMLELAHYEWVEMAVSIAKDTHPSSSSDPDGALSLSPLAWPLAYRFPVHRIGPDYQPTEAPEQATFLVVYRDLEDEVHFLEITPITYQLLEAIQAQPGQTAQQYLEALVAQTQHPQPEVIYAGGRQILQDMLAKRILETISA